MTALIVEKNRRTAPILDEAGCVFSYTEVRDAAQARDMIEAGGFRMIVLDCNMPGLACLALVKQIRRRDFPGCIYIGDPSGCIYIIVVGCPDDDVARDAFINAGADDVISDPVHRHELKKSIHTAHSVLTLNNTICRAYAQMAELERKAAIGRLVPGIAHELNNPLGFVTSNLSVLVDYCRKLCEHVHRVRKDVLKDESSALEQDDASSDIDPVLSDIFPLLDECREGLERMKNLVRDIQQVSSGDTEKTAGININECLDATLSVLWNELKYKAVINKSYGDLSPVFGFPGQLHYVFLTLLLEAALAIVGKGEIDITTSNGNGYVSVTIFSRECSENQLKERDNGFFSLTTAEPWTGEARGLLNARAIVQDHDGLMEKEVSADDGTTFRVRLPVKHI